MIYIKAITEVAETYNELGVTESSRVSIALMNGRTIFVHPDYSFKQVVLLITSAAECLDRFLHKHFYHDIDCYHDNYEANFICTQEQASKALDGMF